ncbi:MAG: 16S rRNA (uracil(1498)-N(3))-methyltransferase [Polyangiaceae bacterium]
MARDRKAPLDDLATGERELTGESLHYLTRVLRFRSGDRFVAFDPKSGRTADATVTEIRPGAFVVSLGPVREAPPAREILWLHGLPKGDKADAIVRDATELGATTIGFVATKHGVAKFDEAKASARRARWSKIAVEAARQSESAMPPEILPVLSFADALARCQAPSRSPGASAFVLDARGGVSLGSRLREMTASSPLVFLVGPEGGLSEEEIALATDAGFVLATFGRRVLRTETVPAAVLGALTIVGESGD